jgi:uncharacterized protein YkwD
MKHLTRPILLTAITITLFASLAAAPAPAVAQADRVSEVFNLVNGVRAENGLPPYTQNAALMVAAQRHSEWGASVGYFDHTGADGSRPTDRAVAAGYGEYGTVRVSENIYWGSSATPQSAVTWWRNSAIHFAGMTSSTYQELGVGVAYGDSGGYFTLVFGVKIADLPPPVAGGSGGQGSQSGGGQAAELPIEPEIPQIATQPARPDGSIVHIVEEGQAIWNIAAAYKIDVLSIQSLNSLNDDSIIHIGNEILVRPASTPTPPPPTPRPPTLTPIVVADGTRMPESVAAINAAPDLSAVETSTYDFRSPLRTGLFITLVMGAGMIVIGLFGLRH